MWYRSLLAVCALLAPLAAAPAAAPEAAGHWEGVIAAPGQELRIQVDLARDRQQAWKGALGVPEQNLRGMPLAAIAVQGAKVHFAVARLPGNPFFDGTVAFGGKVLDGLWSQGGSVAPVHLQRTGEAKFEATPKSTAVAKEFAGTWEGALGTGGATLRLIVKLANLPGGEAIGTVTSVDQGNAEIPISTITQTGTHLILELPAIAATFSGDIDAAATAIAGQWTQGAGKFPLTLKRGAR
jgi:hypothetical protein